MDKQGRRRNSSHSVDNTCVVCFKTVEIYSVGQCDHPVCYECSTRMRVLCKQFECPICRQELPKVYFVLTIRPFQVLSQKQYQVDRAGQIYFENSSVNDSYKTLLSHRCRECETTFPSFSALKDHMRREHEMFFCDLCVEHLKIFTWERRYYKRADLALHRRKGDADDRSHRGHPLCKFCDQRYLDNDELYRHLRRDHFFCHFCDADGLNQYYANYDDLRDHFRDDHFLCEEGDCKEEKFTRVFRTDIDLRAHRAQEHSQTLGKAAAKQARTLELEFTLAPRPRGNEGRGRGRRGGKTNEREYEPEEETTNGDGLGPQFMAAASANLTDPQEFPTLGAAGPSVTGVSSTNNTLANKVAKSNRFTIRSNRWNGRPNSMAEEDFPSLSAAAPSAVAAGDKDASRRSVYVRLSSQEDHKPSHNGARGASSNVSIQLTQKYPQATPAAAAPPPPQPRVTKVSSSQNIRVQPSAGLKLDADFPSLVQENKAQPLMPSWGASTVKKESAKPLPSAQKSKQSLERDDFPSLGPPSKSLLLPKASGSGKSTAWSQNKGKTGSPSSNSNSGSSKKAASVVIPVAETWGTVEALKSKSKKKKNKSQSADRDSASPLPQPAAVNGAEVASVERKVSQMQIGSLKAPAETSSGAKPKVKSLPLAETDFPALGLGDSSSIFDKRATGGAPPPGFGARAPPPGFEPGDLTPTKVTFTSSSGQSFPLAVQTPSRAYLQPPDFTNRNKALITTITDLLGSHQDQFSQFRSISASFRRGSVSANDYYEQCLDIMGEQYFHAAFPELLVLLPDIEKQQQLVKAYRAQVRGSGMAPNEPFVACTICSQILAPSDLRHHIGSHSLESNFPPLGGDSEPGSWWSRR